MDEVLFPDVTVQLVGRDGNAMAIMGAVSAALRKAGHRDAIDTYMTDAMSGDYDNLLRVTMKTVNVE